MLFSERINSVLLISAIHPHLPKDLPEQTKTTHNFKKATFHGQATEGGLAATQGHSIHHNRHGKTL